MRRRLIQLAAFTVSCLSILSIASVDASAEWKESDGNKYYINENGEKVKGWLFANEKWYFFDENGILQKNTTVDGGYEVDAEGAATKESIVKMNNSEKKSEFESVQSKREKDSLWKKENDKWTLYDDKGNRIKDKWYFYNEEWLNFDKNGYLNTNTTIEGYVLNNCGFIDGEPETKDSSESYKEKSFLWKKENNEWYLYNLSGDLVKGCWENNNGVWYYFDEDGKMLKNTTVKDNKNNDCILDSNGALTNRKSPQCDSRVWEEENGKVHCYLNGKVCTGWVMHNNKWYYFDNNGELKKDMTIIDKGKKYVLSTDGSYLQ